jgi:hypothetical protein
MGRDPTNVGGLNGLGSTFWIEKSPSNDWAEHEACANPDSKYFCDDPHLSPKITLATGQLFVRPKHQGRPHITEKGQVSSACGTRIFTAGICPVAEIRSRII